MTKEELVRAFTEGRLPRRAFVRQLVDQGMSMPAALSYADALAPQAGSPNSVAATAASPAASISLKPVQVNDLRVNFVGDGYIVHHPARDRMHSLNHTAAIVLELCTGENDASDIALGALPSEL